MALRSGGMTEDVRLAPSDIKKTAVTVPLTMEKLWRLVTWGSTATTALLIAVLASRGVVSSQRAAVAASTISSGVAAPVQTAQITQPTLQQQAETKRLSDAVAQLLADDNEIKTRLAGVEQNVTDVTGSIEKQIQAAKDAPTPTAASVSASASAPWPDGPPAPATPASIAAVVAPALPQPMEYGVDIGSALSIQALRARWAGIRSAHRDLFRGLSPTVTLREVSRLNSPELRLVVGPLSSADAANGLCASLAAYRLYCEPTIFGGQHLALE
jgi:hypothetical protein